MSTIKPRTPAKDLSKPEMAPNVPSENLTPDEAFKKAADRMLPGWDREIKNQDDNSNDLLPL